jgi:hypothetical protein
MVALKRCERSIRRIFWSLSTRLPAVLLACLAIALILAPPVMAAKGKPGGGGDTGGGKGGGKGGDTTTTLQILPMSLGKSNLCSSSYAMSISNDDAVYGAYAVAQGGNCSNTDIGSLLWTETYGMQDLGTLAGSDGASPSAISDDGTMVGWTFGNKSEAIFQRHDGSGTTDARALPRISYPGAFPQFYGVANGISRNGKYAVGANTWSESTGETFQNYAVLWSREGTPGAWGEWKAEQLGYETGACNVPPGVSDLGHVLINANKQGPASVWDGSKWVRLPGDGVIVSDISRDGTMIVGSQLIPCPDPNVCDHYPQPVYWQYKNNQGWSDPPIALPALDGVDSRAWGLGKTASGQKLIVGYGYTRKDAIMRAVAWVQGVLEGDAYCLVRLAALDGNSRFYASAEDVNESGMVLGTSGTKGISGGQAVIWRIPETIEPSQCIQP